MHALRRSGPRVLQEAQRPTFRQTQRRLASDSHGPTNEGFGISFYIVVISVPAGVLLYKAAHGASPSNPIARLIDAYTTKQETWQEMNALHTRMVEQAGHDRNLFNNTPNPQFTELRFPEAVNAVSPHNVHAGWGNANLEHLIAHYRDKSFADEEEKLQKMREGKLPGQQAPPAQGAPQNKGKKKKDVPPAAGDAAK